MVHRSRALACRGAGVCGGSCRFSFRWVLGDDDGHFVFNGSADDGVQRTGAWMAGNSLGRCSRSRSKAAHSSLHVQTACPQVWRSCYPPNKSVKQTPESAACFRSVQSWRCLPPIVMPHLPTPCALQAQRCGALAFHSYGRYGYLLLHPSRERSLRGWRKRQSACTQPTTVR